MGEPTHEYADECWCNPECVYVTDGGTEVWVHVKFDGEIAPADVIARAIAEAIEQDHGGITRVKPVGG